MTAHTIASTKVVEYSLSPITDYCDKITSILNEISNDNIDSVSRIGEARNLLYRVLLHMIQLGLVCFSHFCFGIVHPQLNSAAHNSQFGSGISQPQLSFSPETLISIFLII